ncbi:MAG TPA: hypothetical protein VHB99_08405 [Pirellulales bacterium]|nr:hypothetical protein [Pirellulales bacterium]
MDENPYKAPLDDRASLLTAENFSVAFKALRTCAVLVCSGAALGLALVVLLRLIGRFLF